MHDTSTILHNKMSIIIIRKCMLAFFFLASTANCTEIKSSQDALDYLKQFGYLSTGVTSYELPKTVQQHKFKDERKNFRKGISTFQMYAGLEQSGKFDNETMNMMNLPRCGMAERMEISENKNINSSVVSHKIPKRRKWKVSRIYYRIANFPSSFGIDQSIAREEIRRAFRLWEEVTNLECIEIDAKNTQKAEIDVLFVSREHGDGNAFGDKSVANVVAHAFFPDHRHFEGDVHFDDERLWTAFNISGINLFQVAAHEIGHALGLDHSRFPDSVMHMIVKSQLKNNFKLHDDEIQGIQKLYGRKRRRSASHRRHHSSKATSRFNQPKVINVNAIISIPEIEPNPVPKFQPTLQNFWKCFSLSREESEESASPAANCYKRNVLNLLYSLKII